MSGRRHPFAASVLIILAAQGVLSAVIATKPVSPTIGATAALGLLLCGLLLVLAEAIQAASR